MSTVVKVLSIRQPWAWLIVAGLKDIENRTWKTDYRGRLLIHAGKEFDWSALRWLSVISQTYPPMIGVMWQILVHFGLDADDVEYGNPPTLHQEELGALVGSVVLGNIIDDSDSVWAEPANWHWLLIAPAAITPIPMPGRLGLFEIPASSVTIRPTP